MIYDIYAVIRIGVLCRSAAKRMWTWSGPSLSLALHALGALYLFPVPGKFINEVLPRMQSCFYDLTPSELANALWGLVRLRVRPPAAWMDDYLGAVEALPVEDFSSQALSDILWSLAKLRYQPSDEWMQPVLQVLEQRLPSLNVQTLGIVLWGIHRLELEVPAVLLEALEAKAGQAYGGEALEKFATVFPLSRSKARAAML